MRGLLQVTKGIDAFMEGIGFVAMWLVNLLLAVGIYNVIARYLGRFVGRNLSSNTFIEGQWYLFSVIFFLGFAFIFKRNQHVRVDFLYSKWSPKRRALVNLFGTLFFLVPFCLLGILTTWAPVTRAWRTWEVSSDPGGLPRAPIKAMIIVAFVLLLIQAVSEIIKHTLVLTAAVPDEEIAQLEEYEQQFID